MRTWFLVLCIFVFVMVGNQVDALRTEKITGTPVAGSCKGMCIDPDARLDSSQINDIRALVPERRCYEDQACWKGFGYWAE